MIRLLLFICFCFSQSDNRSDRISVAHLDDDFLNESNMPNLSVLEENDLFDKFIYNDFFPENIESDMSLDSVSCAKDAEFANQDNLEENVELSMLENKSQEDSNHKSVSHQNQDRDQQFTEVKIDELRQTFAEEPLSIFESNKSDQKDLEKHNSSVALSLTEKISENHTDNTEQKIGAKRYYLRERKAAVWAKTDPYSPENVRRSKKSKKNPQSRKKIHRNRKKQPRHDTSRISTPNPYTMQKTTSPQSTVPNAINQITYKFKTFEEFENVKNQISKCTDFRGFFVLIVTFSGDTISYSNCTLSNIVVNLQIYFAQDSQIFFLGIVVPTTTGIKLTASFKIPKIYKEEEQFTLKSTEELTEDGSIVDDLVFDFEIIPCQLLKEKRLCVRISNDLKCFESFKSILFAYHYDQLIILLFKGESKDHLYFIVEKPSTDWLRKLEYS